MKKWYNIYPKGTPEGEIEEKIFKALTRSKKWKFRSISGMSKELKIKEEIIEEIVLKYSELGIMVQNPQNDLQWGYWEICGIEKKKSCSVQEYDYRIRLKKILTINENDDDDDDDDWEDEEDWQDDYK